MGWASGNEVFDPICRALQQAHMVPEARIKVLKIVIEAMQAQDWDTELESLERFADDPFTVRAFKECGVPADDYAEEFWAWKRRQCES